MDVETVREEAERDLKALLAVMSREDRRRAAEIHREVTLVLQIMQGKGHRFRREATRNTRAIVSEIYSPPRVADAARRHARFGRVPGLSFDLTEIDNDEGRPWDFYDAAKREKAERILETQRPLLLIGTPHVHRVQ